MEEEIGLVRLLKGQLAQSDPATNTQATLLLDTNVLLEIYAIVDLLKLTLELGSAEAARASPKLAYRQSRSRDSIVLAYHLAKNRANVGVLGTEVARMMDRHVPVPKPGEDGLAFMFTTAFVQVVREYVLRDLSIGAITEVDHDAAGRHADDELLRQATASGLPLVTWEGIGQSAISEDPKKLRNRARAAGVAVFSPTEYLTYRHVRVLDEARHFLFACRKAVRCARRKGILANRPDVLDLIVPVYRYILFGEVDDGLRG